AVTLPTKDVNDLHRQNGDGFAAALVAAKATAVPLAGDVAVSTTDLLSERDDSAPVLVCLADVKSEPIEWCWPRRLAFGKLALATGDPGLGKSMLMLDLAARLTTGHDWPASEGSAPLTSVILLSAEDSIADTIRPRLDALGGNPAR